eukprot:Em0013g1055a
MLSMRNKGMGYSAALLAFIAVVHSVAANGISPMCRTPNLPQNGGIKGGTQPLYSLGSVLYYTCNDGYQLQAGFAWTACRLSYKGTYWENSPPTCIPVNCGDLPAPNGGMVQITSLQLNGIARYTCLNGFKLIGAATRTCQTDGTWSGSAPSCQVVDCGTLAAPNNGAIQITTTTVGGVATYICNTGFDLVGLSTRTCQAIGQAAQWSGSAPQCNPINCGPLSAPFGGSVVVTSTSFQGIATYACNKGFTLIGVSQRQCQANEQWSGSAPTCQSQDCGNLPAPNNGAVQITMTTVGGKAMYQCNTGFDLVGVTTRTCQTNGISAQWSDTAPQCNPINCGPLSAPFGGSIVVASTSFQGIATYACNKGLTLIGVSQRQCQANGQWSGSAPTCQSQDCGNLPAPNNGAVQITMTTVGGKATYQCNTGFDLVGVTTRTCQTNGISAQWSDTASQCNPINCGPLSAPFGGSVVVTSTSFQGIATYACNKGLTLIGVSQRQCQANEQWSGSAPTCQSQDCGNLPAPNNGAVQITTTTVGGKATYQCNTGFDLVGVTTRTCQTNGISAQWSDTAPQCNLTVKSTTFGAIATYSCNKGFTLIGQSQIQCQANGQWSGPAPSCQAINCGPLSAPFGGSVVVTSTSFQGIATYACNKGLTLIGVSQRQCQANEQWSGSAPTCQSQDCGNLPAPNNGAVQITMTTVGGKAMYQCNTGFDLVGVTTRTCQTNGISAQWSDTAPQCNPVDCGTLAAPNGGSIKISTTLVGGTAMYACNFGFKLVGTSQRQCQSNGQWSGLAPACQAVDCGNLPAPSGGSVMVTSTNVGGTAMYQCNNGFRMSGMTSRTCQPDGQWSGAEPQCIAVDCGSLSDPKGGSVTVTTTSFGGKATYSCKKGFTLIGVSTRDCTEKGIWSGSAPTCSVVACEYPPGLTNGVVSVTQLGVGGIALYQCNAEYSLSGSPNRICLSDGKWSKGKGN